jgi:glycosyltransferase involved in cell wall biosynthesis
LDLSTFYPDKNDWDFNGLKINQPYFLFLGGISDRRKGWDLLQESIKVTNSQFTLVLVGNLEVKDFFIKDKARVITINEITDINLLRKFYSNARAVLIPSRAEQLPQVATESISCGTPVIAYNVDGLRDIIVPHETGLLINAFDTTSFGLAIDELVNMNEDIWDSKCLDFALNNFSYKVVAVKFKKLLDLVSITS